MCDELMIQEIISLKNKLAILSQIIIDGGYLQEKHEIKHDINSCDLLEYIHEIRVTE